MYALKNLYVNELFLNVLDSMARKIAPSQVYRTEKIKIKIKRRKKGNRKKIESNEVEE